MTEPTHESSPTVRWLRRAPRGAGAGACAPRLGVLSGTFNPPTRAHLAMAHSALAQLGLDEVLFVIPQVPPHKEQLEASLDDRAAMLIRAIGAEPGFSAAVASHGLFLDIHRALVPEYPKDTRFFFLAGRDAAERILLHWPYPDRAAALAQMFRSFDLAVAARHGAFVIPPGAEAARYRRQIHSIESPADCEAVSATQVREYIAQGRPAAAMLTPEVQAYIAECGLYR